MRGGSCRFCYYLHTAATPLSHIGRTSTSSEKAQQLAPETHAKQTWNKRSRVRLIPRSSGPHCEQWRRGCFVWVVYERSEWTTQTPSSLWVNSCFDATFCAPFYIGLWMPLTLFPAFLKLRLFYRAFFLIGLAVTACRAVSTSVEIFKL